jgi:hypothetical protein
MAEALDQDLVTYINDKMLHFYIHQEFENGNDKNKIKAKPKSKSTPRVVRKQHPVQAKGSKIKTTVSAKP